MPNSAEGFNVQEDTNLNIEKTKYDNLVVYLAQLAVRVALEKRIQSALRSDGGSHD